VDLPLKALFIEMRDRAFVSLSIVLTKTATNKSCLKDLHDRGEELLGIGQWREQAIFEYYTEKNSCAKQRCFMIKGDEFMKRFVLTFVLFFMTAVPLYAQSPTADCQGSLKAYVNDAHLNCRWYGGNSSVICGRGASQYTCRCAASNRAPV